MIVPPDWGIPAILLVGVSVVFFGWWSDRRATQLACNELLPPVSLVAAPIDEAGLAAVFAQLDAAVPVPTAVHSEFLTLDASRTSQHEPAEASPRRPRGKIAVLQHPLILLVDADLTDPVALLPALRHAQSKGRSLVLIAGRLGSKVQETLHANASTGRLSILPVTASATALAQLSDLTGTTPLTAQDWISGWLPASAWGTADAWVTDADHSWVLLCD